jgi:hypothetical protein
LRKGIARESQREYQIFRRGFNFIIAGIRREAGQKKRELEDKGANLCP